MATLFFSYSHKDEALRDELEVHLSMLKREGLIEAWLIGGFSPGMVESFFRASRSSLLAAHLRRR